MSHNQFELLKSRRFLPLLITQFLGAFNDNVFKNVLVILITYVAAEKVGQLADKYEKAFLIRIIKFVEILLMVGAVIGFYMQSVWFLMTVLFLMGTQSTFFGPIKYGILPEKIKEDELNRSGHLHLHPDWNPRRRFTDSCRKWNSNNIRNGYPHFHSGLGEQFLHS